MTCHRYPAPDGVAFVCERGSRKRAQVCPCGFEATELCDYPIGRRKTCSALLCERCRVRVGRDSDLCPAHAAMWSGTSMDGP